MKHSVESCARVLCKGNSLHKIMHEVLFYYTVGCFEVLETSKVMTHTQGWKPLKLSPITSRNVWQGRQLGLSSYCVLRVIKRFKTFDDHRVEHAIRRSWLSDIKVHKKVAPNHSTIASTCLLIPQPGIQFSTVTTHLMLQANTMCVQEVQLKGTTTRGEGSNRILWSSTKHT